MLVTPPIELMNLDQVENALAAYSTLTIKTDADVARADQYLERWRYLKIEAHLSDITTHYHGRYER